MGNLNSISVTKAAADEEPRVNGINDEKHEKTAADVPPNPIDSKLIRSPSDVSTGSFAGTPPEYPVQILKHDVSTVFFTSVETTRPEKDKLVPVLLEKCRKIIAEYGGKIAGPGFACAHSHRAQGASTSHATPQSFQLDVGYPIQKGVGAVRGNDRDTYVGEFPGGTVAQVVHIGPNTGDALSGAYAFLKQWAIKNGQQREREFDPWEDYLTPPGSVKSVDQLKTAVNLPIKA